MTKFFLWETGYWNSMDIQHDRAGYYLCWGCLCWVTCVYTSPVLYLAMHPVQLGLPVASAMTAAGKRAAPPSKNMQPNLRSIRTKSTS